MAALRAQKKRNYWKKNQKIFKMKNSIENLIISLVVFIVGSFVGGFIGYKAAVNAGGVVIESQKSTIEKAIQKETTSITNQVTTEIKKIKNRKGEPINVVIDPNTNTVISQDSSQVVTVEKKPGFFKRVFNKRE